MRKWLFRLGINTAFIEPGSPWENGYFESFNGKSRDELLNGEIFDTIFEAKVITEQWRQHYNPTSVCQCLMSGTNLNTGTTNWGRSVTFRMVLYTRSPDNFGYDNICSDIFRTEDRCLACNPWFNYSNKYNSCCVVNNNIYTYKEVVYGKENNRRKNTGFHWKTSSLFPEIME